MRHPTSSSSTCDCLELGGLEVLSVLRSNPQTREIPVIILSNVGDPEMLERGSDLGALEFMIKAQTTPSQLTARIAEHEHWMEQNP